MIDQASKLLNFFAEFGIRTDGNKSARNISERARFERKIFEFKQITYLSMRLLRNAGFCTIDFANLRRAYQRNAKDDDLEERDSYPGA